MTESDEPQFLDPVEYLKETIKQINRAHIRQALESGELEPIVEAIANDE
jgi:hypothetical protein